MAAAAGELPLRDPDGEAAGRARAALEAMQDLTRALAAAVLEGASTAVRAIKCGMGEAAGQDLEAVLEVEGMMAALGARDLVEGVRSFAEGRPPPWPGG